MNATWQVCSWFWWKHRFAVTGMVALVIGAQLTYWMRYQSIGWDTLGLLNTLPVLFTVFMALAVFTFGSNLDLTSGKSSFPKWFFTLPISSLHLALVPALAMLVAFALGWLPTAYTIIHHGDFHNPDSPAQAQASFFTLGILPWLFMCATGNWLQAVAWWPFRNGWYRVFSIGCLIFALTLWLSVGSGYQMAASYYSVGIVVATISGFLMAVLSGAQARHLTWRSDIDRSESTKGVLSDSSLGNSGTVSPKANVQQLASYSAYKFSSASQALRWRDWKHLGRIPVFLMWAISIPMALQVVLSAAPIGSSILLLFLPPLILAPISPKLGLNSYWKSKPEMSPFLAALPVSDNEFLLARFTNCLKTSVVMWGIALAVGLIWLLRSGSSVKLAAFAESLGSTDNTVTGWLAMAALILFSLYLVLVSTWTGLAIGLTGRRWPKRVAIGLVCFAGIAMVTTISNQNDTMFGPGLQIESEFIATLADQGLDVLRIVLFFKILLSGLAIYMVVNKQLLSWKTIGLTSASLVATCLGIVALFGSLLRSSDISFGDISLVTVVLFPFASLFFSRVALDWNRHR